MNTRQGCIHKYENPKKWNSTVAKPTLISQFSAVAQLAEALRYNPECRGLDSRRGIGIFH